MPLVLSYSIIILLGLYGGFRLAKIISQDKNALTSFLILLPQKSKNPGPYHSQADIELSNELYKRLIEFKIPFSIEAVVESIGDEIKFYIFASRQYEKKINQIITSLWPGAETPEVDYEIWSSSASNEEFKPGKHTIVSYLNLKEPYSTPIQVNSDIFSPILQSLSSLKTIGEAVSIQWVIKPAHPNIKRDIGAKINEIYSGDPEKIEQTNSEDFVLTPESIKKLEWKASQPLVATNCRIIAHSVSPRRTEQISENINELFQDAIKDNQSNHLSAKPIKDQEKHLQAFLDHDLDPAQEMILNTAEVSQIFHLPGGKSAPKVKRNT